MYITVKAKKLLATTLAIALLFITPLFAPQENEYSVSSTVKSEDWGLSFHTPGEKPQGNASEESLKEHNAYYVAKGDEKKIYLTFDAGFENGCTDEILNVLKKHSVPATFFLVGSYLEKNPDLVKRMISDGHIVGNHTNSHPDMSKISDLSAFRKELEAFERKFFELTGEKAVKFYRPPQGKYNEENLKNACELGYNTFFWSLAYVDWYTDNQPSPQSAMEKLTSRIHPGAIVLLHSTSKTNATILDELLNKWSDMGYTFHPISELVGKS